MLLFLIILFNQEGGVVLWVKRKNNIYIKKNNKECTNYNK